MSIYVKNLTKIYGKQEAVSNLEFEAKKGEIVGFLGPNGAGKSTTMKITTGFLPPSTGSVEVCGIDVTKHTLEARNKIGYLPEHNPLYKDMYVHESLRFTGSIYGLGGKALRDRVHEMVEITGLTKEQHKKIGALSKGYRQRVGLAQALIHNPEVLILDEPTSGLDANQVIEMRKLITSLGKDKTVVFSSHIMSEVEAICNRVVIINLGKKVADGTFENLKQGERLQRIETEFEKEVNVNLFKELEGVERAEKSGKRITIYSKNAPALRREIIRLAALNDLPLVELKLHRGSLEEVFRELTK